MTIALPVERNIDVWQMHIWNLPDEVANRPQKLQFMQMLENAFNTFDPFRVIGDLLTHRHLWKGAVMDRAHVWYPDGPNEPPRWETDLIKLRDIGRGVWNVDSLFILTETSHDAAWAAITENWLADLYWFEGQDIWHLVRTVNRDGRLKLLIAWWD